MNKEKQKILIFALVAAIIGIALFILRWFESNDQPLQTNDITPLPEPAPPTPTPTQTTNTGTGSGSGSGTGTGTPVTPDNPTPQTTYVEGEPIPIAFPAFSESADRYATRPEVQTSLGGGLDIFGYAPFAFDTKADQGGAEWQLNSWYQKTFAATNPLNIIKRGTKTYYVKPTWTANNNRSTFDFFEKFPAFTPPANKIVALGYQNKLDVQQNGAMSLARGLTHVQHTTSKANKIFQVGDGIWHDIGCPSSNPYDAGYKPLYANWLASVTPQAIVNKLDEVFQIFQNQADLGFFNNESIIHPQGTATPEDTTITNNFYKIADGYAEMARRYPNVKFLIYGNSVFTYSYYLAANSVNNLKNAYLDSSTDALDLASRFGLNTVSYSVGKSCSVIPAYGSMDTPYFPGELQLSLMAFMVQKKCFPNKKYVFFPYVYNEFLIDTSPLMPSRFALPDGTQVYNWDKSATLPSALYNRAVWGICMMDGGYMWGEPRIETEDTSYYRYYQNASENASMGTYRADTNSVLTSGKEEYLDGHRVLYFNPSMKGIDWMMAAVWAVSQPDPKAIIEAPGDFSYVINPFDSYQQNKPLVASKTANGKTMVIAYWGKADGEVQHNLTINGQAQVISTFGDFTSVVVY